MSIASNVRKGRKLNTFEAGRPCPVVQPRIAALTNLLLPGLLSGEIRVPIAEKLVESAL